MQKPFSSGDTDPVRWRWRY